MLTLRFEIVKDDITTPFIWIILFILLQNFLIPISSLIYVLKDNCCPCFQVDLDDSVAKKYINDENKDVTKYEFIKIATDLKLLGM